MASTGTCLNFEGTTEEAFNNYKSVFGADAVGGIMRMGDVPPQEGQPELSDEYKQLIMHIALPTLGDHVLMGTDTTDEMGFTLTQGNNVYISLDSDTRVEADRFFAGLADGGKVESLMAGMFWGDYWGSFTDKYGVQWMINQSKSGSRRRPH